MIRGSGDENERPSPTADQPQDDQVRVACRIGRAQKWYWKLSRDGSLLDNAKVVYGQSFAIYN